MYAKPMVFGLDLILATSILVVVLARFNSWDQFFYTFFKSLRVRVSIRVIVRVTVKVTIYV